MVSLDLFILIKIYGNVQFFVLGMLIFVLFIVFLGVVVLKGDWVLKYINFDFNFSVFYNF